MFGAIQSTITLSLITDVDGAIGYAGLNPAFRLNVSESEEIPNALRALTLKLYVRPLVKLTAVYEVERIPAASKL